MSKNVFRKTGLNSREQPINLMEQKTIQAQTKRDISYCYTHDISNKNIHIYIYIYVCIYRPNFPTIKV